jgi:hypothetical protein
MLREQLINVLQSAVVFLVLTNLATLAAVMLMRQAQAKPAHSQPMSAIERNLQALLRRVG